MAELVSRIKHNVRRYVRLFNEVIDSIMPQPTKDLSESDDVIDVVLHQRANRNAELESQDQAQDLFPAHLVRR